MRSDGVVYYIGRPSGNLPALGGLELLSRLSTVASDLPVLVLSMHAEPLYVTRAMEAGARGYVSKNIAPDELVSSLSDIADALGLGYKTIANTCTQIKAKLGVNRTADLVRVAPGAGIC
jgi:two-component system, NarL family, invasion response regulator UvrY